MDKQVLTTIKIMIVVLLFGLGLFILYRLSQFIGMVYTSFLLALAIEPVVKFFSGKILFNKPIPRTVAVFIAYLIVIAVVFGVFTMILPPVVTQLQVLYTVKLPYIGSIRELVDSSSVDFEKFYSNAFFLTVSVFSNFLLIITAMVVSLYISIEWLNMKRKVVKITPKKYKTEIEESLIEIEQSVGNWAKGQLILMLVIGVASITGLLILDVDYALSLGLLSGLLEFVPLIGPIVTAILGFFIGLSISPVKAIAIVALFILIQQLESNLLVPKVMQKVSGFSPLLVLLAVLVGTEFYGVIGALIVIPTFMIGAIIVKRALKYSTILESE